MSNEQIRSVVKARGEDHYLRSQWAEEYQHVNNFDVLSFHEWKYRRSVNHA